MKHLLFTFILMLPNLGFTTEIASINFKSIEDTLRADYFSQPENRELAEKYKELNAQSDKMQLEMQESISSGKPVDVMKFSQGIDPGNKYEFEKKIKSSLKELLYSILREIDQPYQLVYDSSDSSAIIYADTEIRDITPMISQALIKRKNTVEQGAAVNP